MSICRAFVAMCLVGLAGARDLSCVDSSSVDHTKTVVAAVGDSITVGLTCNDWIGGYTKILQDLLGDDAYDVRDCGLNGHTAVKHGNYLRKTYWYTDYHNNSKAMNPDIVIFMLGTNDAAEWATTDQHFNKDYTDLVKEYKNLPSKPKVITMIPPPYENTTCTSRKCSVRPQPLIDNRCVINCELPGRVSQLAFEMNLPQPLDLLTLFHGPDHTDIKQMPGLHPNCEGYRTIGHYVASEYFGA